MSSYYFVQGALIPYEAIWRAFFDEEYSEKNSWWVFSFITAISQRTEDGMKSCRKWNAKYSQTVLKGTNTTIADLYDCATAVNVPHDQVFEMFKGETKGDKEGTEDEGEMEEMWCAMGVLCNTVCANPLVGPQGIQILKRDDKKILKIKNLVKGSILEAYFETTNVYAVQDRCTCCTP